VYGFCLPITAKAEIHISDARTQLVDFYFSPDDRRR
jgi:hypothetical protein